MSETVRVRIAVAVSATGMYVAHGDVGQGGFCESFAKGWLEKMGGTRMPWHVVHVEADVPLPSSPEIQGAEVK